MSTPDGESCEPIPYGPTGPGLPQPGVPGTCDAAARKQGLYDIETQGQSGGFIHVSDQSFKTGSNEDRIKDVLNWINNNIDSDCAKWLSGFGDEIVGLLGDPRNLDTVLVGHGAFDTRGVSAFSFGGPGTDIPPGYALTVNDLEAFFFGSFVQNGNTYTMSVNGYTGGTSQAQVAILLHELGHSQNKRIWKGTFTSGNLTAQEVYFYGVDGQKLGTYSLILNYGTGQPLYLADPNTNLAVYFGGKRVAVNGTAFIQDRLGSNTQGKYYPYGEDRGTPPPNDQVKFATYTRDSATGLDYADQRYYSNQFGRFMSVDQHSSGEARNNPQLWNKYAYVGSDPINYNDPSGRERCSLISNGEDGYFRLLCNGSADGAIDPSAPDSQRDDGARIAQQIENRALNSFLPGLRQSVLNALGRAELDLKKADCASLFGTSGQTVNLLIQRMRSRTLSKTHISVG